jgi:hypothetical protein
MNRAVLERVRALSVCLLLLRLSGDAPRLRGSLGDRGYGRRRCRRHAPELAAAALDGRIYVAGGIAQWGTTTAFEAYDPATDRWEELPPLPEAVHHLAAAATNDRIYITGGYTNLLFTEITDRAWAYDPRERKWVRIADLPAPRAAHGMAAIEGKLYVVGGVGPTSEDLWIYDPGRERWEAAPAALPTQREHLTVTALESKLHAIGGRWISQKSPGRTKCRLTGGRLRPKRWLPPHDLLHELERRSEVLVDLDDHPPVRDRCACHQIDQAERVSCRPSRTASRHSRLTGRIGGFGTCRGAAVGAAMASFRVRPVTSPLR